MTVRVLIAGFGGATAIAPPPPSISAETNVAAFTAGLASNNLAVTAAKISVTVTLRRDCSRKVYSNARNEMCVFCRASRAQCIVEKCASFLRAADCPTAESRSIVRVSKLLRIVQCASDAYARGSAV